MCYWCVADWRAVCEEEQSVPLGFPVCFSGRECPALSKAVLILWQRLSVISRKVRQLQYENRAFWNFSLIFFGLIFSEADNAAFSSLELFCLISGLNVLGEKSL